MTKQQFNPDKIIGDYNIDYYAILGLERGSLPTGTSRNDKVKLADILQKAYRNSARHAHPDFGGSEDAFRLVVRAQRILEDPLLRQIYKSGGKERPLMAEDSTGFEIDWDKIGTYRQGTKADTIGYDLFLRLSERKKELNIVPSFRPTLNTHSYEWDWTLPDQGEKNIKLSLSIVQDDKEVLRLTHGEDTDASLPFKIYFCIPRPALYFLRDSQEEHVLSDQEGSPTVKLNGKLKAAAYSDYDLFETTSQQLAEEYITKGGKLESDLENFRNGSLIEKQKLLDQAAEQSQWVKKEDMEAFDAKILRAILRSKSMMVIPDDHAADFLENLPG